MSRSGLERHEQFAMVSPAVGELDEDAFDMAVAEDPDAALSLLPQMAMAADERLRMRARKLAGRIVIDRARRGAPSRSGIGRPRPVRADTPGADFDVDRSLEALSDARSRGRSPEIGDLHATDWGRSTLAVCLLVDRSGSMSGSRLTAAALAAAACAVRAPDEHAVLVFSNEVIAVQAMGGRRSAPAVVDDLLVLRGKGTTDLAAALHAAAEQLSRARGLRRVCILLSDCEQNCGDDPVPAAAGIDELFVIGPASGNAEAELFRQRVGARGALADGPTETVSAVASLLR